MYRKLINAFAVAAVVALGGTAIAQQQNVPQQTQQMQQPQPVQGQAMQGQLKSVRLSALNQAQLKQVQMHLKDLGFYKGTIDGNLGNDTRSALLSYFQSQVTLMNQGKISDSALSGFGFSQNDIERVRGIDQGNVRENTQGRDLNQQQQQMQQPQQQQPQQQPQQQQQQQPQY